MTIRLPVDTGGILGAPLAPGLPGADTVPRPARHGGVTAAGRHVGAVWPGFGSE